MPLNNIYFIFCVLNSRYVQIVAGEYFYKIQKKGLIEDKNNLYRHLVNSFQESPNILDHLTINVPHIERLTLCKKSLNNI